MRTTTIIRLLILQVPKPPHLCGVVRATSWCCRFDQYIQDIDTEQVSHSQIVHWFSHSTKKETLSWWFLCVWTMHYVRYLVFPHSIAMLAHNRTIFHAKKIAIIIITVKPVLLSDYARAKKSGLNVKMHRR